MKAVVAFLIAFAVTFALATAPVHASENGGTDCAVCTLLVALVEQTMQLKQVNASTAMSMLCSYLPDVLADACELAIVDVKPKIIPLIDGGNNPDAACAILGKCFPETAVCRLFPPNETEAEFVRRTQALRAEIGDVRAFNICTILPGVCSMENHEPFSDTDGDMFSTMDVLRGAYWRGRDCDDLDASVFPGRNSSDAVKDSNCNGIYGVDAATGQPYESQWCDGTGAVGVAALGDSATAHFRIPPSYFNASELSKATFANILRNVANELDWPMLSWSTGHLNASDFAPDIAGPVTSVYSQLLALNRCNKGDFQNQGVNGARTSDLVAFVNELARSRTLGVKPLVLIFSMVGNDVCNSNSDPSSMTTPTEYFNNVMAAIQAAEAKVPAGTKLVLVPLVDGRILYDTMNARIHPIGSTNQDVTYTAFYNYLNCLHVSPCAGWLNSNATIRNSTWAQASLLNDQIPLIINATKSMGLKNVEVVYVGNVYDLALQSYQGPRYELIEPVDGFHPSQLANSLIGQTLTTLLVQAGVIAPANPNNAAIIAKFGN